MKKKRNFLITRSISIKPKKNNILFPSFITSSIFSLIFSYFHWVDIDLLDTSSSTQLMTPLILSSLCRFPQLGQSAPIFRTSLRWFPRRSSSPALLSLVI